MSNSFFIMVRNGIVLIIVLFLFNIANSQTIKINSDGSADIHFNNQEALRKYVERLYTDEIELQTKDSLINEVYKPYILQSEKLINHCDSTIIFKDNEITALKERLSLITNVSAEDKKLIEFNGLYAGIKTGYLFSDTVFSQSKFVGTLWDNLSGYLKTGMSIKDFRFNVYLEIPLSKQRHTGIYFEGGYRIF